MKKLPIDTIEQRHKFYKKLLDIVCADPAVHKGLCDYISQICEILVVTFINRWNSMNTCLPELWKVAPKTWTGPKGYNGKPIYFYPLTTKGWEKRIAMIEKAIEATKPKKFKKA